MSDLADVHGAATAFIALGLPITGLLNNAGIMQMRPTETAQGWDTTFAPTILVRSP